MITITLILRYRVRSFKLRTDRSIAMKFEPDFSNHDYYQLLDAKANIDQKKYPTRYKEVVERLADMDVPTELKKTSREPDSSGTADWKGFQSKPAIVISTLVLIIFMAACVYFGKIPTRRGISLEDDPFMFFFCMCIFGAFLIHNIMKFIDKYK